MAAAVAGAALTAFAPQASAQPAGDAAARCAALAGSAGAALGEPSARVTQARLNPATAAMPEHCEVLGSLRERVGSDGQKYAVRFRVRLPTGWNDRFLFAGGGGTNGALGATTGQLQPGMPTGLAQGYAVVSTDTGHDNTLNNNPARQGQVAFAHDYLARLEYAETALDSVATAAKRLVAAFYGRAAHHNYFAGCSNGGREGMVFAQRFPDQFDGILATAPAFALPKAAMASAWDTQTFASLAVAGGRFRKDGLPDIPAGFSDADRRLVGAAITAACDAADGAADGMIQDLLRCDTRRVAPQLAARTCKAVKAEGCLSADQVRALTRSMGGPRDSRGRALYAAWPWDVGIAAGGWRVWKTGAPGGWPVNVTLLSPATSAYFVTPPVAVADTPEAYLAYQLAVDFDRDLAKAYATTPAFPRSSWDLLSAQSTDLERFRRRGGRMIVPHGGADPIFSVNDTVHWWRALDRARGGKAAEFVRAYPVPGMNHCGGGPATDAYDALGSLVAWVEEGRAPDRIEARAAPSSPWPGRTRPLCPYPAVATWRGGDLERSESFVCARPRS